MKKYLFRYNVSGTRFSRSGIPMTIACEGKIAGFGSNEYDARSDATEKISRIKMLPSNCVNLKKIEVAEI